MKKKPKFLVLKTLIFILIIAQCYAAWHVFIKDIVPITKTNFENYDDFKQKGYSEYFYNELPLSASNIKYFYHEEFLFDKKVYSCILSDEDYLLAIEDRASHLDEEFKDAGNLFDIDSIEEEDEHFKQYLEENNRSIVVDNYSFNGKNKLFIKNEKTYKEYLEDFVIEVIQDKDSLNNYYYLSYYNLEYGNVRLIYGAIANDKNNEIVEFSYEEKLRTSIR